jgi:hypothetical protein
MKSVNCTDNDNGDEYHEKISRKSTDAILRDMQANEICKQARYAQTRAQKIVALTALRVSCLARVLTASKRYASKRDMQASEICKQARYAQTRARKRYASKRDRSASRINARTMMINNKGSEAHRGVVDCVAG